MSSKNQHYAFFMDNQQCKICGRKAVYHYYSVLACCACKVFFRRNASKGLVRSVFFCLNRISLQDFQGETQM